MKLKLAIIMVMLFALIASPAKSSGEYPYWKAQCGSVITWSMQGGRKKIVKQTIIILDAAMTNYTFVRVAPTANPNIKIVMNAGPHPEWAGVAYVYVVNEVSLLNVEVNVFVNKNRKYIGAVLMHEMIHAIGVPHIDNRKSIMNTVGEGKFYPQDWDLIHSQNARCDNES